MRRFIFVLLTMAIFLCSVFFSRLGDSQAHKMRASTFSRAGEAKRQLTHQTRIDALEIEHLKAVQPAKIEAKVRLIYWVGIATAATTFMLILGVGFYGLHFMFGMSQALTMRTKVWAVTVPQDKKLLPGARYKELRNVDYILIENGKNDK